MKNWGGSLSVQWCYLHSFSNAPWMFSTFKNWVDTVMPVFTVWHIGVSGTKGNWGKDRNVFGKSFLFMFNFCLFYLQRMLSTAVKAKFVSAYCRPQRKYISQNLTPFHMGDVFVQFFQLAEGNRDLHTFCPLANINLIRIRSTQAIILSTLLTSCKQYRWLFQLVMFLYLFRLKWRCRILCQVLPLLVRKSCFLVFSWKGLAPRYHPFLFGDFGFVEKDRNPPTCLGAFSKYSFFWPKAWGLSFFLRQQNKGTVSPLHPHR